MIKVAMERVQPAEGAERNNRVLNHAEIGTVEGHVGATKLPCFDKFSGSVVGSPPTKLHDLKVNRLGHKNGMRLSIKHMQRSYANAGFRLKYHAKKTIRSGYNCAERRK
jgi:hypothetical protein